MGLKLCQRTSKRLTKYFVEAFAIDMGECIETIIVNNVEMPHISQLFGLFQRSYREMPLVRCNFCQREVKSIWLALLTITDTVPSLIFFSTHGNLNVQPNLWNWA